MDSLNNALLALATAPKRYSNATSADFNLSHTETSNTEITLYCCQAGFFVYSDTFITNLPDNIKLIIQELDISGMNMIRSNDYLVIKSSNIKSLKYTFNEDNQDYNLQDSNYLIFSDKSHPEDTIANEVFSRDDSFELVTKEPGPGFIAINTHSDGFAKVTVDGSTLLVNYSNGVTM